MGVKRTRLAFEGRYTQFPNDWARDKRLSRRARGLLVEIMTHRVGWRITIASLQEEGPEGRDAIRTGLQELFDYGYLVRSQSQGAGGRFKEVEYELCDPSTGVGKSDSGESEPAASAEKLSTGPTAVGFSDVGSAVDGSADVGESATKKNQVLEEPEEKDQGGASAPPAPFCSRHSNGTTRSCRACGDARRRYDLAARAPAPPPAPRELRYDPTVYCEHLQLRAGPCEACTEDARREVTSRFAAAAS